MALPATENFASANDPLTDSADWSACGATADSGKASGGVLADESGNGNDKTAFWASDSFANDQYAQIKTVLLASATDRIGVVLRCSAGNEGLMIRIVTETGDFQAYRWNSSATRIQLGSDYTPSETFNAGDGIRLEISGTTLTLLLDFGSGFVIETTFDASSGPSSGSPGIYIADAAINTTGDDWEGGDLAGGSIVPILSQDYSRFAGGLS